MATLASLACLPFYSEGNNFDGTEIRGDSMEFWIAAIPCGSATNRPDEITITTEAAALADAETISVSASVAKKVWQGDVIKFDTSSTLVVVKTTTEILTTATTVPVLPLEGGIADNETAKTYGMLPVWSLSEGGIPETSGQEASSRNRSESLFPVKIVVGRDYSINCNGRFVKNDPGAHLLESLSDGPKKIYWESRYAPYVSMVDHLGTAIAEGSGPAAKRGTAFVQNFSMPATSQDMQQLQCTLMGSGSFSAYVPLI